MSYDEIVKTFVLAASLLGMFQERQETEDPVKEAGQEFSKMRFRSVLRVLEDAPELLKTDPKAQYLAGYAWIRLHRPELGKPLLRAAAEGNFNGYPGWESTQTLLQRIGVIERLRPPPARNLPEDERLQAIRVFADDTPWIREVLKVLPEHVTRAREVFGKDLPLIDFYLFRSMREYNAFYKALFGVDIPTSWQNGTGNTNIVTFCQEDREGKPVNPPGSPRGLGDVLHEYSHALLNTVYGDGYLRLVPQWLDEGLSDFLARAYYKELFDSSAEFLRTDLLKSNAPSYEDLSRRIYEREPYLRYSVARFMVEELLKGRSPDVIRDILRRARPEGDFEKAIFATTTLKGPELRAKVIARFR